MSSLPILLNIDPNQRATAGRDDLDGWESACTNKINPYEISPREMSKLD